MTIQHINYYRNTVLNRPSDDQLFVCIHDQEPMYANLVSDRIELYCIVCQYKRIVGQVTLDRVRMLVDQYTGVVH